MAGVGDRLGAPVRLPSLFAVLVNPRRALATRDVFQALGLEKGAHRAVACAPPTTLEALAAAGNDLEAPAQRVLPAIGDILDRLKRLPGAKIARMSGSGATCFALFDDARAAAAARARLAAEEPGWWIAASALR